MPVWVNKTLNEAERLALVYRCCPSCARCASAARCCCRAASRSWWRWRARWRWAPGCCCWTSLSRAWRRRCRKRLAEVIAGLKGSQRVGADRAVRPEPFAPAWSTRIRRRARRQRGACHGLRHAHERSGQDYPVPAMRHEALHGDRLVRCFAERPQQLLGVVRGGAGAARRQRSRGLRRPALELCRHRRSRPRGIAAGLARARRARRASACVMFIGNRPEFVFVLLALQRLGAIAVPVGVREQRPGLAYIARQCGAMGVVFDADAGRAHSRCRRGARRWRCASRSAATRDSQPGRHWPTMRCRAAAGGRRARDRRGRDPLHLGHHRPPQGRDAHAPEHRAFGAALPGLHAPGAAATARRWRCRPAMSPA